MIDNQTKQQLAHVFDFMLRIDPNGEYYGYFEDLEAGTATLYEVVMSLTRILYQWKRDINNVNDPMSRGISKQQIILSTMI